MRLDCFRNLTGAVHSEIQGEKKGIFYLIHALIVQYGDEWPDFGFGHGLHMIEINMTSLGIWRIVEVIGATVTSPRTSRMNVPRQDQYRSFFVRCFEGIPTNFTASHQSIQACSSSKSLNSPELTGCRR